jgi:hypothetical protein
MRRVVAIAIVLACGTSRADPHRRKVAQALSGIGTGVSSAIALSAFLFPSRDSALNVPILAVGVGTAVVTPTLGEWYAGDYVTIGLGIRLAAAGLGVYGATRTETGRCSNGPPESMCQNLTANAIPFLGLAAIAFIGGAAYDVIDAPTAVDRHTVHVAPMVTPTSAGLGLAGQF